MASSDSDIASPAPKPFPHWVTALIAAVCAFVVTALLLSDVDLPRWFKPALSVGSIVFVVVFILDPKTRFYRLGLLTMGVFFSLVTLSVTGEIHINLAPMLDFSMDLKKSNVPLAIYFILPIFSAFLFYLHINSRLKHRTLIAIVVVILLSGLWIPINDILQTTTTPVQQTKPTPIPVNITPPPPAQTTRIYNRLPERNLMFTGRETELVELKKNFHANTAVFPIQAVYGIGGMGKTQVAIEYLHRHESEYDLIWWVRAETQDKMLVSFMELADRLELPGKKADDKKDAALQWLADHDKWLLILDNVKNAADLEGFLPWKLTGHILITSRSDKWGDLAIPLELKSFPRHKSIELLENLTDRKGKDHKNADALADRLGDFPLALAQAGAYMAHGTKVSFHEYLERYEKEGVQLFNRSPTPRNYEETVATVWNVSLRAIAAVSPEAKTILELLAFLDPDAVPLELLKDEEMSSTTFEQAIQALGDYSLVSVESGFLTIHRLLQDAVREGLKTAGTEKKRVELLLSRVDRAFLFKYEDVATWKKYTPLVPHVVAVVDHAEPLEVAPKVTIGLLNQTGDYFQRWAKFERSLKLYQRALELAEKHYGNDATEVALYASNLGGVLKALGRLEEAKSHFERALAIDEKTYGKDHPEVATDANNLGSVLQALGRLEEAKSHFERALAIGEKTLGKDHPNVAVLANNLGLVLQDLGRLEEAKSHFERALVIDEKTYGKDHPDVAIDANNLGSVLKALGRLEEAKSHFERALAIGEKTLGKDHPNVAVLANNLGLVLQDLGRLEEAKSHFERALVIDEKTYGKDHPDVAIDANNLGSVLKALGRLEEAKSHLERALAIALKFLGADHPNTKIVQRHLQSMQ